MGLGDHLYSRHIPVLLRKIILSTLNIMPCTQASFNKENQSQNKSITFLENKFLIFCLPEEQVPLTMTACVCK